MLNIAVQASRIAVLAILITQANTTNAQQCKDGICSLTPHQAADQLTAPTPRRSPSVNLRSPNRFDGTGANGHGDSRPLDRRAMPSNRLTGQDRYRAVRTNSAGSLALTWEKDIQKGAAIARETGRPMLIQVTADWCGYCRKMKSEVFSQTGIQRNLARGFVTVEMNADQNKELVQRLGIKSLPTTLILTPDLQIADRMEGFRSADQLQVKLDRFLPRAELHRDIVIAAR
ncbi:MAG: thioredoxin family protein [Fuerstiella sp.]